MLQIKHYQQNGDKLEKLEYPICMISSETLDTDVEIITLQNNFNIEENEDLPKFSFIGRFIGKTEKILFYVSRSLYYMMMDWNFKEGDTLIFKPSISKNKKAENDDDVISYKMIDVFIRYKELKE